MRGVLKEGVFHAVHRKVHGRSMYFVTDSGAEAPEFFPIFSPVAENFIKYSPTSSVSSIGMLPAEIKEIFLQVTLAGGDITVHRDGGRIHFLNPLEWGEFWFKIQFFLAR